VYSACVFSTLLYGSETWTAYARQEWKLNTFLLRNIHHILQIIWQDRVTNAKVLSQASLFSVLTVLGLGHVRRMDEGCIPKDVLYSELTSGSRSRGQPRMRYRDVCKGDMTAIDIDTASWQDVASDRTSWRSKLKYHLTAGEEKLLSAAAEKWACRRAQATTNRPESTYKCDLCGKSCHAHISLLSPIIGCIP